MVSMLYLEDYLELIEHLPQELRDRFTLIRENDLHVNNSSLHIDTKVKQFFAQAEELSPEQRQCEYEDILKDFEKTLGYADDKVQLADQTHDIMVKLIQKLDGEIDKFKLELEADHAGISLGTNHLGFKSTFDPQFPCNNTTLHRTSSNLKSSFASINSAELGGGGTRLDSVDYHNHREGLSNNRNALAPMAPGQQAFRYNQHHGRLSANGNLSPSPYLPITKSGRSTKRPKHHASHIYPDESPPPISSDNSVFENSESMSSADFIDSGTAFSSTSPSSFDCTNSSRISDQSGGAGTFYQRDETKYCLCRQISYGAMVACDSEECEIEWFHYNCVGITQPPKGKWYCFDCTKRMNLQNHHHTSSHQQTQTHRKRGRKEMMAN